MIEVVHEEEIVIQIEILNHEEKAIILVIEVVHEDGIVILMVGILNHEAEVIMLQKVNLDHVADHAGQEEAVVIAQLVNQNHEEEVMKVQQEDLLIVENQLALHQKLLINEKEQDVKNKSNLLFHAYLIALMHTHASLRLT